MYNPKISIIIPCFNASLCLSACIESILRQKYVNFEVLLIDDGSSDSTVSICKNYVASDNRIKLICHNKNNGVSAARNTGLHYATGEWIAFVDADDTVSSTWLSEFEKQDVSTFDLITHPIRILHEGKITDKKHNTNCKNTEQNICDLYVSKLLGFVWSFFLRRSIIQKNQLLFDCRLKGGEDLEFLSRYILFVKKIMSFNEGFYVYNVAPYDILKEKAYTKIQTNVYFRIYSNLTKIFVTPKIKKIFVKAIAPNLIVYITSACYYHIEETNSLMDYYNKNVRAPWFLNSSSGVGFVFNILIKLHLYCCVHFISKILYKIRKKKRTTIYIDFDK